MSFIPHIMVIGASMLGAIGQILFKKGADNFQLSLELIKNYWFIGGAVLYLTALIITMFAYKQGSVSVLYTLIAFSYIWVMLLAAIFLKEPLSAFKILGGIVIIGGIALVNFG